MQQANLDLIEKLAGFNPCKGFRLIAAADAGNVYHMWFSRFDCADDLDYSISGSWFGKVSFCLMSRK